MANLPVIDMIKALSESLFHIGEKKKLKALKVHNEERDKEAHPDLFSKVQGDGCRSEHLHRMEHHGMEFWTYYYPGEHPEAVLLNKPIQDHIYGTMEQQLAIESHMLDPEFAAYDSTSASKPDGVSEEWLCKKRWTGLLWVGEAALSREHFKEAEGAFRCALEESKKFKVSEVGESRTLSGLAKALTALGQEEEAEQLLMRVMELDEHIVGHGNVSMEEEFYTIARHFIEQRRYAEVIEIYEDLIERLTQSVGRRDPMVARCLNELGLVYFKQLRFDDAEPVLRRAVDILNQFSGLRNKQLAVTMQNLAKVLDAREEHDEAENLLQQAIKILEREPADEEDQKSQQQKQQQQQQKH